MTNGQIKDIFSRFQNLNLLFLIEDLKRGLVSKKGWLGFAINGSYEAVLCPIAHGWRGFHREGFNCCELAGIPEDKAMHFVHQWDNQWGVRSDRLLSVLGDILAERQADADAIQSVIEQPTLEESYA